MMLALITSVILQRSKIITALLCNQTLTMFAIFRVCVLRNKFVLCTMYNFVHDVVTYDVSLLSKSRVVLVRWTIGTSDFSSCCI